MAKTIFRRRSALDNPEEVLNLAQRLMERVKPYTTWLVVAGVVIAVGLGGWGVNTMIQERRQEKAAAALAQVSPKADLKSPDAAQAQALEKFIHEYAGTPAAREAQLTRANLLYGLGQYGEGRGAERHCGRWTHRRLRLRWPPAPSPGYPGPNSFWGRRQ